MISKVVSRFPGKDPACRTVYDNTGCTPCTTLPCVHVQDAEILPGYLKPADELVLMTISRIKAKFITNDLDMEYN